MISSTGSRATRDDVTEELQLGGRAPRFLQDDVLEAIAHQLADRGVPSTWGMTLSRKFGLRRLFSTASLSAARCL